MTLIKATEWQEEQHEWLIPGLVGNAITLISGEPKTGKSLLAGYLVNSLITQAPILGREPKEGFFKVAWIGYDTNWGSELKDRFPDIHDFLYFNESIRFDDEASWLQLMGELVLTGIDLLVVDHLYGLAAELDLDESHLMTRALQPLKQICDELKIPVLLLAHANKSGSGRAAHSILLEAQARHFIRIIGNVRTFNRDLVLAGNHEAGTTLKIFLSPEECFLKEEAAGELKEKKRRERNGEFLERTRAFLNESPVEARISAVAAGEWMAKQGYASTKGAGRTLINKMMRGGLLMRLDGKKSEITAGNNFIE